MSKFEKQLHTSAKGMKLSAAEKRELKARVVSYMEYHPRRETVAAEKAAAYLKSQPYSVISFNTMYTRLFVGMCAVFMFVFIPTIAERAVPGDVLYPVKVRVNEEIRSTLTFSPSEKVAWETERLERRISEVRLLANEGKLTDEVEAAAVAAVKEHAEAAQENINKLKGTDADEASLAEIEFESALQVQSAVLLAEAGDETPDGTEMVDGLAFAVEEAQKTVGATRSTSTPAYAKISARIETQTTRAYELFASITDANLVSVEERAEIERRFVDIERAIAANTQAIVTADAVDTQVDAETAAETFVATPDQINALLLVIADIKKLISFMADIDVRGNVKLDELVPVVLTEEERVQVVTDTLAAAQATIDTTAVVLADETLTWERGVREKVLLTHDLLQEEVAQASSTLQRMHNEEETNTVLVIQTLENQAQTVSNLVVNLNELIGARMNIIDMVPEETTGEAATTTDVIIDVSATTTDESSVSEDVTGDTEQSSGLDEAEQN